MKKKAGSLSDGVLHLKHMNFFSAFVILCPLATEYRSFVKNESDTQSEWEIIRQRTVGRDRGKRTIRWYRYAAAIFLPLLIASGYFIKLSRTPQEKTLVSVPFIPGKSYAVLELADGTSIDLGETAVRGQIQGGHWEVRSDSLKYCEEGVKGGEEYHTLKVPRGGEYTLVLADGSKVFLNAESSLKYPVLFRAICAK